MSDKTYMLYAASYSSKEDAKADLEALKAIKRDGEIRDLTAAIVSKNDKGRLHVHETTHAGAVAAGVGVVAGAIIGAVFPPGARATSSMGATSREMRFVFRDNLMFEEKFTSDEEWVPTADLSRPFYRGDTDLVELTPQEARQFQPRAFED